MREKMHPLNAQAFRSPFASARAEALEPRRLLAGIEAGVLVARGTEAGDVIALRSGGEDHVTVITNGDSQTFARADFTGVRLEGLGGHDTLDLIDDPGVSETVLGGAGDDRIVLNGAGMPEAVDAGTGRDALIAFRSTRETIDASGFAGLENILNVTDRTHLVIGNALDNRIATVPTGAEGVTMRGGAGNDTLEGGADREVLLGEEGDDYLVGWRVADTLDGGAGTDIGDGGPGVNTYVDVELSPPAPRIRIVDRTLIADGAWGVDVIRVTQGAAPNSVTVTVNESSQTFDVDEFDGILVRGNSGFDAVEVANPIGQPFVRPVTLVGGGGNDTLNGTYGDDVILGGDGNDRMIGLAGDDSLVGAFGMDHIDGGGSGGTDTVDGGPGEDTIVEAEITPPPPRIEISDRVLVAEGAWGVDLITLSRAGRDHVVVRVNETARIFNRNLFDDVLLRGQDGFDYLRVTDPFLASKVTLVGGNGNDTLLGDASEEVLRGGTQDDVLRGFGGNDALFGDAGSDFLDGGDDNDFLDAADGAPRDTVLGGPGADTADADPGDDVSGVETFA